jgi:hypothetical protein
VADFRKPSSLTNENTRFSFSARLEIMPDCAQRPLSLTSFTVENWVLQCFGCGGASVVAGFCVLARVARISRTISTGLGNNCSGAHVMVFLPALPVFLLALNLSSCVCVWCEV